MTGGYDCDGCLFYEYDEEYECYVCTVYLDEDELERHMSRQHKKCPYYKSGDEYKTVKKQM